MQPFLPKPKAELAKSYKQFCIEYNLVLVTYFSGIAILIFGLHLIHHFRLGMEVFSASMIPYTLLYSFNFIYALVNLLVLPKIKNIPALRGITVLLEMAYPFFMGLVCTVLAIVGVAQEGGPTPFVAGMMIIAVMLQGHFLALLVLLFSCWMLLTVGLFYSLSFEQASSQAMICLSVVVAAALIARLTEKTRIQQFNVIQALDKKDQQLRMFSQTEPLTGLTNRQHFSHLLDVEVNKAMRYNNPLGLLLINVDDFSQVNHQYGQAQGDEALVQLAKIVKQASKNSNFVCRFNGDELCVLLVEANTQKSIETAQDMVTTIANHEFNSPVTNLTVSIGHTQYRGQSSNEFIESAYVMLTKAKNAGKNQVASDSI